jgi:hypothetical protein
MLGSTAIRGSADATWQLIKKEDGTRTFQTEMRYGVDLPPTRLLHDEETHSSSFDRTEAFVSKRDAARTADRIEGEILAYVVTMPGSTKEAIFAHVTGNRSLKVQILNSLEKVGLLIARGEGTKGKPYQYETAIPIEPNQSGDALSQAKQTEEETDGEQ